MMRGDEKVQRLENSGRKVKRNIMYCREKDDTREGEKIERGEK